MPLNPKCPKCGSSKVRITTSKSKHSLLWLILFGWLWVMWWICKAMVAFCVLLYWDWWYALIKKNQGKGYVWISKKIIQPSTHTFYCEECSHNFKG